MSTPSDLEAPRFPVRLVALRTGLSPHVLRAWERRYGVVTPTRSEGGQRLYSQLDVERLTLLHRLTERGHAIGRIAALGLDELARLEEESAPEPPAAHPPAAHLGDITASVLEASRRFDATELQALLERAAVTLGVPDFLDGVVAPALEEIGRGWSRRTVSVAQEHLGTRVFLRVLGWLLRLHEVNGAAPRIVVATPPGQAHELGALMVAVSAAAEGWAVTYLGPDLPAGELVDAAQETGARVVAMSVVYVPGGRDPAADVREVRAGLPARVPVLLGGAGARDLGLEHEAGGVIVLDSLADLRALLRRLREEDAA